MKLWESQHWELRTDNTVQVHATYDQFICKSLGCEQKVSNSLLAVCGMPLVACIWKHHNYCAILHKLIQRFEWMCTKFLKSITLWDCDNCHLFGGSLTWDEVANQTYFYDCFFCFLPQLCPQSQPEPWIQHSLPSSPTAYTDLCLWKQRGYVYDYTQGPVKLLGFSFW